MKLFGRLFLLGTLFMGLPVFSSAGESPAVNAAPRLQKSSLAVLVGIRDYDRFPVNAFALLDMKRFQTYLREEIGIPAEREITLENPTGEELRHLLDSERGNLWKRVEDQHPTSLVLYLHLRSIPSSDKSTTFLLGKDAHPGKPEGLVSVEGIQEKFDALGIPAIVLLDGGIAYEATATRRPTPELRANTSSNPDSTGTTIIRSYGEGGLSYWDSFQQSSYFTSRLLTTLERRTGPLTARQLVDDLSHTLGAITSARYGSPQLPTGTGALDALVASASPGQTGKLPSSGAWSIENALDLEVGLVPVVTLASGGTRGLGMNGEAERALLEGDRQVTLAKVMPTLKTGDLLKLTFHIEQPAYLYVANLTAAGEFLDVVPHVDVPEFRNPIQGLIKYPPDEDHFLEVTGDAGTEHVIAFLSRTPREDLLSGLKTYLTAHQEPWTYTALSKALATFASEHCQVDGAEVQRADALSQTYLTQDGARKEVVGIARQAHGKELIWIVDSFYNAGRLGVGPKFRKR